MCVIIVKDKNVDIPSKEYLQKAWDANPHGAGFMFENKNKVEIHKGFMDFKSFYKFLNKYNSLYNLKEKNVIFHFRISTHAGVNKENTQPFAVCDNDKFLGAYSTASAYGFAHNGILSNFGTKTLSDTADFVKSILAKCNNIENNLEILDAIAKNESSKFAVMNKNGDYFLCGNWTCDKNLGYKLSNDYFLAPPIYEYKNYKGDYDFYKYSKKLALDCDEYSECDYCLKIYKTNELSTDTDDYFICNECKKYFYGGF